MRVILLFQRTTYITRAGKLDLAFTATDEDLQDCLNSNHASFDGVEKHVINFQNEDLAAMDYIEVYLKVAQVNFSKSFAIAIAAVTPQRSEE